MKVRVEVEMLASVAVLVLALGVSDGLVVDKCQLGNDLNVTLSASLLDQIPNLVAKIVCHVELSSHFNTSAVDYISGPNGNSFSLRHHGIRKGRSAESSSEESSEEDNDAFNGTERRKRSASRSNSEESDEENAQVPKPGFNSSAVIPVTRPQGNNSFGGNRPKGRRDRSAESSSEESREENAQVPKPGFNSSTVIPVTRPQGNNSFGGNRPKGRRYRSAESSSEESREENAQVPKPGFNSSMVIPVTSPQGNNSFGGNRPKGRRDRSAESSSRESEEKNIWTLYGLFQLPDRIACTSGFKPSLNLCNMACDSLIDDDIRDDITCVETIINKMISAESNRGPSKALFHKLREAFFQKDCNNAEDLVYFAAC